MNKFSANIQRKCKNLSLSVDDIQNVSKLSTTVPWKRVDELNEYMWKTLRKSLMGCTACCPFCKEMCDAESVCDYKNKKERHFIRLHRPGCFAKYTWIHNKNIMHMVEVCTSLIESDCRFRNSDTNWEFKPYKQYQDETLYPNWNIPFTTKPLEPYWIWVITHFDKEIAEWCNGKTNSIPKEWYEIKDKRIAIECVRLPKT